MPVDRKNFQLRYVGDRFKGHRLPLDVLPDLAAFRDLVVSYVKAEWRGAHTKRERLPKGFEKSIAFNLTGIADGSAIPTLEWDRETAQFLLPDFKDELETLVETAYDRVLTLVDRADNPDGTALLSSENIRALNRFGSGLLDRERIEFVGSQGSDGNVVYLDFQRRKRLITRGRDSYQTRFESIGKLLGSELETSDAADGSIKVETMEYGMLTLPVPSDRVRDEFDGNIDAEVQFALMIELNNNDTFRSVVEVFDVDVIDGAVVSDLERCRTRISKLGELTEGWNNGDGVPIRPDAATAAFRLLAARPRLAGRYHIYPTDEGGLLMEFVYEGWDYGIEIGPNGAPAIYGVQLDGPGEFDTRSFGAVSVEFLACLDERTGETI